VESGAGSAADPRANAPLVEGIWCRSRPDDPARETPYIRPSLTVFRGLGQPFIENFPARWIIRGSVSAGNIVLDFESATPSVVKSIRQRDLLNTWLRLYARQHKVPSISEYQPARIEDELPDLVYCTVDPSAAPPRVTIQSDGTRLSHAFGHTGKGRRLDDYFGARLAALAMPVYYACIGRGLPVYTIADIDDIYGRVVAYERLLLPFATDDKITQLIVSVKTISEDGGFEIRNLMRGNDAMPRLKLRAVIDRDLFHRAPGRIAAADVVEFADQSGSDVTAEIIELN
jgi:hypothetical protein